MVKENIKTQIPSHLIKDYTELDKFIKLQDKYMLKTLNAVNTFNKMEGSSIGGFSQPTSADCYHLTETLPEELSCYPFVWWGESWIVFTSPSYELLNMEDKRCHEIRAGNMQKITF